MSARDLLIGTESLLAAVLAGAILVWIYNRFVAGLRESYLKKSMALGVLPMAAVLGAAHGWALASDLVVIPGLAWLGAPVMAWKTRSVVRRRRLNRGVKQEPLTGGGHGVNFPFFSPPVALVLRAITPLNEVDRVHLAKLDLELDDIDDDLDGMRLLFLTDFHVHPALKPEYYRDVVRWSLDRNPDAILLGGDFVSRPWHRSAARRVLEDLASHPQVVAVRGNHDFWTRPAYFAQMLRDWNVRLLTNDMTELVRGNGRLPIVGLEDPYIPLTGRREAALAARLAGKPALALVHTPQAFAAAQRLGCRFALAGHTHGGQIRLPFFGTTISACPLPEHHVFGRGGVGDMGTFVSNGIGAFYPMRIMCPPQVVEITLRAV